MKQKIIFFFVLLFNISTLAQIATPPAEGNGTVNNPYRIVSLENLYWIAAPDAVVPAPTYTQRMGSYYIQMNDIDASSTSSWFDGAGWLPIGNSSIPFIGKYDGQFYSISNLTLNRPGSSYMGLFGLVGYFTNYNGARTIQNVFLNNVDIFGKGNVGGLIGRAVSRSVIHNCHVSGIVKGVLSGPHISERINIGGLIGNVYESRVAYSSANTAVEGSKYVGGLIGRLAGTSNIMDGYWAVEKSYSAGSVYAPEGYVGGLVGEMAFILRMSYSRASVVGNDYFVGGLIGYLSGGVWQIYSTGHVSGCPYPDYMGGLIGFRSGSGEITGYWDMQTSGQSGSQGGYGRTTAQMKTQANYTAGYWPGYWGSVWTISSSVNNGYPALVPYLPTLPEIATAEVTEILPHKAVLNGNLISTGIPVNVLEYGFCWNTSDNPGIDDNTINLGIRNTSGTFQSNLEGLQGYTTYYTRAYAINSTGISYGEVQSFTTLGGTLPTGEGTASNPYNISTLNNLLWICNAREWDKHYRQTANISAVETADWNEGSGFYPIGDATTPFTGTYYGQGWGISGLVINRPGFSNVGMFGHVTDEASLSGIKLTDANVVGGSANVGILVGYIEDATILDCSTGGFLSGLTYVGGIAGNSTNSTFKNCTNDAIIVVGVSKGGGVVGYLDELSQVSSCTNNGEMQGGINTVDEIGGIAGVSHGDILHSENLGNIGGRSYLGGIVGKNYGLIDNCNNQGDVNATIERICIGGIAGYQTGEAATVSRSFNTGNIITGHLSSSIGGLIGWQGTNSFLDNSYNLGSLVYENATGVGGAVGLLEVASVVNCYSIGSVTAIESVSGGAVGGLIGGAEDESEVNGSFWNIETSTLNTSADGTGLTTAQMKELSVYTDAGWSFVGDGKRAIGCTTDCWDMDLSAAIIDGYPFLGSQQSPLTWTGNENENWHIASNWTGSLGGPSEYKEVIIPNLDIKPVITNPKTDPAKCASLILEENASLTIKPNAALTISGEIVNSGELFIESNSTGSGSLIHETDSLDATIQVYVTGGPNTKETNYKYHLLSIPLLDSIQAGEVFMGSYLWYFMPNVDPTEAWVSIQGADILLHTKAGYLGYVPQSEYIYSFEGKLNNGNFNPSIEQTLEGNYNLIPNPYPSALDWDAISLEGSNLEPSIWFFNSQTGNYLAYNGGDPVGGNIIPVGQSVFVKALADNPVLQFNNDMRVHHDQALYKCNEIIGEGKLIIKATTGNSGDQTILRFRDGADNTYNKMDDATKLRGFSGAPQIYSLSVDGFELAINTLSSREEKIEVPIAFELNITADVHLDFENTESFDEHQHIYLEDIALNSFINLRQTSTYNFIHDPDISPLRFKIHFADILSLPKMHDSGDGIDLWSYNDEIHLSLTKTQDIESIRFELYDILGRKLEVLSLSPDNHSIIHCKYKGIIIAKLDTGSTIIMKKLLIR